MFNEKGLIFLISGNRVIVQIFSLGNKLGFTARQKFSLSKIIVSQLQYKNILCLDEYSQDNKIQHHTNLHTNHPCKT